MLKTKICQFCDKPFDRQYHKSDKRNKTNPGKFCSQKCHELGKKIHSWLKVLDLTHQNMNFKNLKTTLEKIHSKKNIKLLKQKSLMIASLKRGLLMKKPLVFNGRDEKI